MALRKLTSGITLMEMCNWNNEEIVKYLKSQNHFIFYEALSQMLVSYIIPV